MTVETSPSDESTDCTETGQRVLVVDDSVFFRQLLEDILSEAGYLVEAVASGEAALAST